MKTVIRTIPERCRRYPVSALVLAAVLAVTVLPAYSDSGIPWNALSRDEQSVLAKHRSEWSSLSPDRQRKLREGASQYLQLPPDKRQAVERKHSQYEKMSPREREQLRQKYSRQRSRD